MNFVNKKVVVIGATSAMAEKCTRIWVENGRSQFVLVGRDKLKLQSIAQHLVVMYGNVKTEIIALDFNSPQQIASMVERLYEEGVVDTVLIAHGFLPSQEKCQDDLNYCNEALKINGLSPILFLEAFVKKMEKLNYGHIGIIGSVAGDRGRKSNYVYGAAKGLIETYVEGLQHRLAKLNIKITLIKPGPTNTPMTADLGLEISRLASVDLVAKDIVNAIEKGVPVIYTPRIWQFIMLLISNIPRCIFNRLNI